MAPEQHLAVREQVQVHGHDRHGKGGAPLPRFRRGARRPRVGCSRRAAAGSAFVGVAQERLPLYGEIEGAAARGLDLGLGEPGILRQNRRQESHPLLVGATDAPGHLYGEAVAVADEEFVAASVRQADGAFGPLRTRRPGRRRGLLVATRDGESGEGKSGDSLYPKREERSANQSNAHGNSTVSPTGGRPRARLHGGQPRRELSPDIRIGARSGVAARHLGRVHEQVVELAIAVGVLGIHVSSPPD